MENEPVSLKKKSRSSSFKAATATLVFYGLLFAFAGSIIVVRYIQKQQAEFVVSAATPKLEHRPLQVPVQIEKMRESTHQTKIVSRKVSAANPSFTAPDMGKIGTLSSQKFSLPPSGKQRDFGKIASHLSLNVPQVDFFGLRAEGEKFVFIIDGSSAMLTEETGGLPTYGYVKDSLRRMVSTMPAAALFNVILYDGGKVYRFRPQLVPATKESSAALGEWIQPVNSSPSSTGLTDTQNNYRLEQPYQTAVGSDADGWLLAVQAAFEQRADNVCVLCPDWGIHRISPEKRRLLLDFSLWELLDGGGATSIGGTPIFRDERKLRDDLIKQAVVSIQKQESARQIEKLPQDFLHDIPANIEYAKKQILDHIETVYRAVYAVVQMERPRVYVVRMVSDRNYGISDASSAQFLEMVRKFGGEFGFLNSSLAARATTGEKQFASQADSSVPSQVEKSVVRFMDASSEGARVAFILDASAGMLTAKNGGTNSYESIKDQLVKAVASLLPGTLFNVAVYDGQRIALFRPQMVPAGEGRVLSQWLAAFNRDSTHSGLSPEQNNYIPARGYDTAIGEDVRTIPYSIQAMMEEQADLIFVVSTGIGTQPISREKARRLFDFSVWNALGGSSGTAGTESQDEEGNVVISAGTDAATGAVLQPLQKDQKLRQALLRQAIQRIDAEKKSRAAAGLPAGFVPDILNYVEYSRGQVSEHIATVCNANYTEQNLDTPKIHFICLLDAGANPSRGLVRELRDLTQPYSGTVQFFQGTDKDLVSVIP